MQPSYAARLKGRYECVTERGGDVPRTHKIVATSLQASVATTHVRWAAKRVI